MKPSVAIVGKTDQMRFVIEAYGFEHPMVFGSTARGEDVEGSDLDILAFLPERRRRKLTLQEVADVEADLQELTGVVVDFYVQNDLPVEILSAIYLTAISL